MCHVQLDGRICYPLYFYFPFSLFAFNNLTYQRGGKQTKKKNLCEIYQMDLLYLVQHKLPRISVFIVFVWLQLIGSKGAASKYKIDECPTTITQRNKVFVCFVLVCFWFENHSVF